MKTKPVFAYAPANYNGTAVIGAWVSLKNHRRCNVVITTGAWPAGTAAVTLSQARDASGTGAKALTFSVMHTNKSDPTSAVLKETAVSSNTFNLDTANSVWAIPIRSDMLDATNGFSYLRVNVASPGANNDLHSAVYVLEEPRYEDDNALNERA